MIKINACTQIFEFFVYRHILFLTQTKILMIFIFYKQKYMNFWVQCLFENVIDPSDDIMYKNVIDPSSDVMLEKGAMDNGFLFCMFL